MTVTTLPPDPLRDIAGLPGPRGLPWLGNAHQVRPATIHRTMEAWSRAHGPVFRASLGARQVVVVSDSAAVAAILRDRPDGFRRPAITADISRELGGIPGQFLAEGDDWRHQRRMVMQAFGPHAVKACFARLAEVALRLQDRWHDAATAGRTIDLSSDLKRYTVDAIAGLAFGADVDTIRTGDDAIQRHMDAVLAGVSRRSLLPVPYWRWLRLPADRRLERSVRALQAAVDGFVGRARAAMAADPVLREQPANLLQAMLAAADQPDSGVTDATVADNVSTLLLAGEDTTASALGWLLWLLHRNPAALARAQAEVLRHVPDAAALTRENVDALDYVEACALEAMRLKPPAPFIPLQALRDTQVLDVRVPKETLVWCVLRHDSMDERIFPRADEFDPARWLPEGGGSRQAALPFGAGPRMCPGRYLSLMEVKMAVAVLLARFELLEVNAAAAPEPAEVFGFVMGPSALRMRLAVRTVL